ncbi:NLI interacting factor-like phosphatase-domain-containing protein [Phlyctochytrium arcticum]|nr:NLI interacting factor-like phosphatase-domain-containing protein [Phlyctochytrium arcticum]
MMHFTMVKAGVTVETHSDQKRTIPYSSELIWSYIRSCLDWLISVLVVIVPVSSWREKLQSSTQKSIRHKGSSDKLNRKRGSPSLRRSRRLREKNGGEGVMGVAGVSVLAAGSDIDQITDSDSNSNEVTLRRRSLGRAHGAKSTTRKTSLQSQSQSRTGSSDSILRSLGSSSRKRKTLVLDLDETLIHSTSRSSRNHDHIVEVLVDRHVCLYYVYKRPFCDLFMQKVSEWYKVVIFTASMPEYAMPVIDWLDPTNTLVSERYFRAACRHKHGTYVKDLAFIESDLSQVCLVDNSPISYQDNEDNGIPIDSWISDPRDEALLDLLPFLDALRFVDDVRHILSLK